jgi:phage-related protein
MGIDLKPIRWLGTTRDDIREQRRAIRNEFGQQLFRVQMGLTPNNYKPMSDIDIAKKRYREARDG